MNEQTDKEVYSHSRISTFQLCPRKFWLQYRMGLEPKETSKSMLMGSYFSNLLELHWNGEVKDREGNKVIAINPFEVEIDCAPNGYEANDLHEKSKIVEILASGYVRKYGNDKCEREVEFSIDDPPLRGFMDGIIEGKNNRLIVEDKLLTSRYWTRASIDSLKTNGQVSMYLLAAKKLNMGIDTLEYRVTMKPSIYKRKNEKTDSYLDRFEEDVRSNPIKYYKKYRLSRTDEEIEDFELSIKSYIEQVGRMDSEDFFPVNPGSCTMYGGCSMLSACTNIESWQDKYKLKEKKDVG